MTETFSDLVATLTDRELASLYPVVRDSLDPHQAEGYAKLSAYFIFYSIEGKLRLHYLHAIDFIHLADERIGKAVSFAPLPSASRERCKMNPWDYPCERAATQVAVYGNEETPIACCDHLVCMRDAAAQAFFSQHLMNTGSEEEIHV